MKLLAFVSLLSLAYAAVNDARIIRGTVDRKFFKSQFSNFLQAKAVSLSYNRPLLPLTAGNTMVLLTT